MYINLNIDTYDNLPLLSEERKIFDITQAYVHLPYSVAEYGCGKRADVTTKQLFDLGISANAIRYGMIMEPDMSADALAERDHILRPHALSVNNPLADLMDFTDPVLIKKILETGASVDMNSRTIAIPPYYDGEYVLHTEEQIGFNLARSHIFLILNFYDLQNGRIIQRVLDPMLDAQQMFAPQEIRGKLNCPQGVLFSSSIGGYFMLMECLMTGEQQERLSLILGPKKLAALDKHARNEVIRRFLNNAPKGSIGDPETWTYGNNMRDADLTYNKDISAKDRRERHQRMDLETIPADDEIRKKLIHDIAAWSEDKLLPLANLVNCIRVHKSTGALHMLLKNKPDCAYVLQDDVLMDELRGFGVRLRERIDRIAEVSRNEFDEIDARTFTSPFISANIELIKQMNEAGMLVFLDKVGNVHGILSDRETKIRILNAQLDVAVVVSRALGFHSHIDTVFDAGKYDGRLGVLSGLEVAHVLYDLSGSDPLFDNELKKCPLLVSAYVNEEMTYTGGGVSMPGSSAVAGLASAQDIYKMEDPEGNLYLEGLCRLIKRLRTEQKAGTIQLGHVIHEQPQMLFDPQKFLPHQSIERHCEQADIILKSGIPMTQVNVIMGIFQEDYHIQGDRAEQAALHMIRQFHILNHSESSPYDMMRITNGAVRKEKGGRAEKPAYGMHFILYGKKDHAGSTARDDRYDPAIAAARLMDSFYRIVDSYNLKSGYALRAVSGDFNLYAKYTAGVKSLATARNAIADVATLSLGIAGKGAGSLLWTKIYEALRDELNANTKMYGDLAKKDLFHWEAVEVAKIRTCRQLILTLDVRYPEQYDIAVFMADRQALIEETENRYALKIKNSVEQELLPLQLDKNKNVSLILDGSIGGSHNPHEAEYPEVVLAGTILQLAATLKFMNNPDKKIFDTVQETLPLEWQQRLKYFYSGALHDACQIAAGIDRRLLVKETFDIGSEKQ